MSVRIADGEKGGIFVALDAPKQKMIRLINHRVIVASFFLGKDPSPPLQFGDGPTTSPLSNLCLHFSGVIATMLRA